MTQVVTPMAVDGAVDPEHGMHLYREMLRIRRFEERCVELYSASQIRGFLHLYIGEEAVAVGVMGAWPRPGPRCASGFDHGRDVRSRGGV
jgi:TPP-dependent pyruvate/acetoin dehydrogenase alpha subunit